MVPNLNSCPLVDCTTSPNNSNQSDNRMLPYPPMDVSAIAASLAYSSEKCVVCNDNDVHHTCAHTRVNANTPRLPIFPQWSVAISRQRSCNTTSSSSMVNTTNALWGMPSLHPIYRAYFSSPNINYRISTFTWIYPWLMILYVYTNSHTQHLPQFQAANSYLNGTYDQHQFGNISCICPCLSNVGCLKAVMEGVEHGLYKKRILI